MLKLISSSEDYRFIDSGDMYGNAFTLMKWDGEWHVSDHDECDVSQATADRVLSEAYKAGIIS